MTTKDRTSLDKIIKQRFSSAGKIFKNERNLESIRVIIDLKPKSKELLFVNKILFSENISDINLNVDEVKNLEKKLFIMQKRFINLLVGNPRPGLRNKRNVRLIEIFLRLNPGTKELEFMKNALFQDNTGGTTLRKGMSTDEMMNKLQETASIRENAHMVLRNALRKINLDDRKNVKYDLRNKQLEIKHKKKRKEDLARLEKLRIRLNEHKERLENIENKIENFSHLKNCCSNCEKTITKKYKNSKIKNYKISKMKIEKSLEEGEKLIRIKERTDLNTQSFDDPYLSFNDARTFVRSLGLKSKKEWLQYIKTGRMPGNIPLDPTMAYSFEEVEDKGEKIKDSEGWVDIYDWLGVPAIKLKSYLATKAFAQRSKIKTEKQWIRFCNSGTLPANIPKNPDFKYPRSWKNWHDFLN